MKTADIKVRCIDCDCYVVLDADQGDSDEMGMCHANPPQVIMVPHVVPPSLQSQGGQTLIPATVFPLVRALHHFCAHHPQWGEKTDEQIH